MAARLKSFLLFFSLAYLTVYAPVMTVAYSPFWYRFGCVLHGRCDWVGEENARAGIRELADFMRHEEEYLPSPFWTGKEKNHLAEVRRMLDVLTMLTVPSLVILGVLFDRRRLRRLCLANMILVMSPLLVLPFFKYFWRHVFHPLLFSNKHWLNTPADFSYYILPRVFFMYTLIYIVVSALVINITVYVLLTPRCRGFSRPMTGAPGS